ncbi:DgyrCDS13417 [Dimorphilus gyrociliatus]|uniref:DgyrCDS13417 n=1 Tax=Dimorphilus gyrociliatus TaxID=2664684 RepID=A0A7I8WAN8_9ANNE|nr:DgyrCDS13417 [Dimorphilus gyrociliatus]
MRTKWPNCGRYPAVNIPENKINWRNVCLGWEKIEDVWKNNKGSMIEFSNNRDFAGVVDCCLLYDNGNKLVTGSRNKSLQIFDLEKLQNKIPFLANVQASAKTNAHSGWIWCMEERQGKLATGSWDTSIKIWDLNNIEEAETSFKAESPILCLRNEEHKILAGSFHKKLYTFDKRVDGECCKSFRMHTRPILAIDCCDKYVITGSEEGTIKILDRRLLKSPLKVITLPKQDEKVVYPTAICYNGYTCWVGDSMGNLTLINAANNFETENSINALDKRRIGTILERSGGIFVAGGRQQNRSYVNIYTPTNKPTPIASIEYTQEISRISEMNGTLAIGLTDGGIKIWRPALDVN